MPQISTQIHQIARPDGFPRADQFTIVERTLAEPQSGQAIVENLFLSVDPYMRGLMDGEWELHAPLEGRAIGRVLSSRGERLHAGQMVFHRESWCSHALVNADDVRVLPEVEDLPLNHYLSVLGGTGLTAYVALTRIARLRAGDDLFVSAAAGGVGTATAQIARLLGAGRLVGSTGSAEKARYLVERLAFDATIDYSQGDLPAQLASAAPKGLDIYIDNVGGEHLAAAIGAMRDHGRIVGVGSIAQYNDRKSPTVMHNLYEIVGKSLRIEGFVVRHYQHLQSELEALLIPHLLSGSVVPQETLMSGLHNMVQAFLDMLAGRNLGKMIVAL